MLVAEGPEPRLGEYSADLPRRVTVLRNSDRGSNVVIDSWVALQYLRESGGLDRDTVDQVTVEHLMFAGALQSAPWGVPWGVPWVWTGLVVPMSRAAAPQWTNPLIGEIEPAAGHGTFIAGLIRQTEPSARVLAVRVMYNDGVAEEADVAYALTALADRVDRAQRAYAVATKPKDRKTAAKDMVDIVSLSLGFFADSTLTSGTFLIALTEILDKLRQLGVLVVAAAGRLCLRGRDSARATLETRLERRLARAELGAASGDVRMTFTNARAGLEMLQRHRGGFGSVDLLTSTTSLGAELARTGLAEAVERRSPPEIFRWLELSRAQAFRFPAVRPAADTATSEAVAELRQLAHAVRTAELAGHREVAAIRRCAELERLIRAKGWQTDGAGAQRAQVEFGEVRARLAHERGILLIFLREGDQLRALVISGSRAQLCDLGDLTRVTEAATRLRSDLDVLCGRRLPAALRAVVQASVAGQLAVLSENLLAPLRKMLGDLDIVLVPTGPLSALPWGLLPELRGRPVTVTPSASFWQSAKLAGRRPPCPPLLVAGPHLDHAPDEIGRIARVYPDATILRGPQATVEAALRALDGRTAVHFATHGHHEPDNVLFSRLDLTDGPLMAYDIHQLDVAPEHVILSSCDVGRTVVRTGDETLGFTVALLCSSTRTVVSSVARVDDRDAVGVMAAYHNAVRVGTSPARALADAALTAPLMPLVCFGCG